jgi:predicted nucleic acid-binding protein
LIVDSSVWIAHLRATDSPATRRLRSALARREAVRMPDVVLMEVLRGARDSHSFLRLERALLSLPRVATADARGLFHRAAHLYARCHWAGFTPRSGNDCLIACQVIEAGEGLLHDDRDFLRIAGGEPAVTPLLIPGTPPGARLRT